MLGLDGGGTKTDLAVAAADGPELARLRVAGTSLARRSAAAVAAELAAAVAAIFVAAGASAGDCAGACAGFASAADPERARIYAGILHRLLPGARRRLLTDCELAWLGAACGADAIILIAGTGSIAWGRRRDPDSPGACKTARAGGLGPGRDRGSGDWLGRQAVAAALLPPPADGVYAALVPRLATDPRAQPLFQTAGIELAALLDACARDLDWALPRAYPMGGVLEYIPAVRDSLAAAWPHPLLPPCATPLQAAIDAARALLASSGRP